MNDVQWLRHWCAQHIEADFHDDDAVVVELARKAESAANRDGFSVERAIHEEGFKSMRDYLLNALKKTRLCKHT